MPLSTDIRLPKLQEPIFPDKCVVCHAESPGNTVKVSNSSFSWWTLLIWWYGHRHSVRVPACRVCAFQLQVRRWGAYFVAIALTLVVVFFVSPWLTPIVVKPLRRWVLMIAVLICLLPFFIWEILFPPAFEITANKDSVDFEFRDENYADQFLELNSADEDSADEDQTQMEWSEFDE